MIQNNIVAVRLLIRGNVQGVGYRAWVCDKAQRLNITGTVKNLHDGTVECMAQGDKEHIDAFIAACRIGPPKSVVTHIERTRAEHGKEYSGFSVIY